MKTRNKMQKEGQKRLIGLQGQKHCKKLGGKRQKIDGGALAKSEREKRLKSFEKEPFGKGQSNLLKTSFTSFDRSKNSLDRLKQTETLFKKFETSSIDRKSVSIDRNRQRLSLSNLKIFDQLKNKMDRSKWAEAHQI